MWIILLKMKKVFDYLKVFAFYLLTLVVFIGSSVIAKQSILPDLFSLILATIFTFIWSIGLSGMIKAHSQKMDCVMIKKFFAFCFRIWTWYDDGADYGHHCKQF